MNLMGLTSSRRESRTNAYTERILSLDGNVFSSCVRSGKRTLIVVYSHRIATQRKRKRKRKRKTQQIEQTATANEKRHADHGSLAWTFLLKEMETHVRPSITLRLCLLLALRARQQRGVVQRRRVRAELLLSRFEIGDRGCEVIIRQLFCPMITSQKEKERKGRENVSSCHDAMRDRMGARGGMWYSL